MRRPRFLSVGGSRRSAARAVPCVAGTMGAVGVGALPGVSSAMRDGRRLRHIQHSTGQKMIFAQVVPAAHFGCGYAKTIRDRDHSVAAAGSIPHTGDGGHRRRRQRNHQCRAGGKRRVQRQMVYAGDLRGLDMKAQRDRVQTLAGGHGGIAPGVAMICWNQSHALLKHIFCSHGQI